MPTKPVEAPPEVEKILKALEPHTVSAECLYLPYSRLDPWKLAGLSKFFGEDEYRRLGLRKPRIGEDREALRHGR